MKVYFKSKVKHERFNLNAVHLFERGLSVIFQKSYLIRHTYFLMYAIGTEVK
jgi:hypothetical protein